MEGAGRVVVDGNRVRARVDWHDAERAVAHIPRLARADVQARPSVAAVRVLVTVVSLGQPAGDQARIHVTGAVVTVDQRVVVRGERVHTPPDAGNAATIIDIRFWAIIEGVNIREALKRIKVIKD